MKVQAKDHEKAAEHHMLASKHHTEAAKCCESGDLKAAAHHALIADSHAGQALEHSNEAKKKYATSQGEHKWEAGTISIREV